MIEPNVIFVPLKDLVVLPAYYSVGPDHYVESEPLPDEEIIEIAFFDELTRYISENDSSK